MNNILQNSINVNELFNSFEKIEEKEIYGIIYKITNLITDKIYIGQTIKSIEERFKSHIRWMKRGKKLQYLHKSMKKYGIDNFIIEQIDIAYSLDDLNQKEYDWIVQENSIVPNGYNLVNGGGKSGYSQETIEKLRQSKKNLRAIYNEDLDQIRYIHTDEKIPKGFVCGGKSGFKHNQEQKDKIRKNQIGKKSYHNIFSGEVIYLNENQEVPDNFLPGTNKHTNKGKIYIHNPETLETKMIHPDEEIPDGFIKGKIKGRWKHSEEYKNMMSIKHCGENNPFYKKTHTTEAREKIRKSRIGKHHSDKTKDKISKSNTNKKKRKNE